MDNQQASPANGVKFIEGSRFVKAGEVAKWIGITAVTLNRWARLGKLNGFKIGPRLVVYDEHEVLEFIRNSRMR